MKKDIFVLVKLLMKLLLYDLFTEIIKSESLEQDIGKKIYENNS